MCWGWWGIDYTSCTASTSWPWQHRRSNHIYCNILNRHQLGVACRQECDECEHFWLDVTAPCPINHVVESGDDVLATAVMLSHAITMFQQERLVLVVRACCGRHCVRSVFTHSGSQRQWLGPFQKQSLSCIC